MECRTDENQSLVSKRTASVVISCLDLNFEHIVYWMDIFVTMWQKCTATMSDDLIDANGARYRVFIYLEIFF